MNVTEKVDSEKKVESNSQLAEITEIDKPAERLANLRKASSHASVYPVCLKKDKDIGHNMDKTAERRQGVNTA